MTDVRDNPSSSTQRPRPNVAALLSLTFGAVACIPFLGVVPVILGILGLRRSRRLGGRGMAAAGIGLGLGGLAWTAILGLFIIPNAVRRWEQSEPARRSAQLFMVDLGSGKLDDAMMRGGENLDRRTLDAIYTRLEPLGTFNSVSFTDSRLAANEEGNEMFNGAGRLSFERADAPFEITLVRRGGMMYVDRVKVDDPLLVRRSPATAPRQPATQTN